MPVVQSELTDNEELTIIRSWTERNPMKIDHNLHIIHENVNIQI